METKRKIEIAGISIAVIILARHFVSKYKNSLKLWTYLRSREEKFKNLFITYKFKSLFVGGKNKTDLLKNAERCRRKAEWYMNKINDLTIYEK